jgi:2-dehydropantoate 2-reductase
MKIAVVGAGAMGAMTGVKLAKSGQDVVLVDVWKEHIDEITKNGLLFRKRSDAGERIKVKAVYSADEIKDAVDLIIIFVKGMHTSNAIQGAKNIIGPDTYVMTIQNGIGNAEVIADYVAPEKIILGTTSGTAILMNPGEVNDTTGYVEGQPTVQINSYTKDNSKRIDEIAEVLTKAGISTMVSANTELAIWEKLAINCCYNTLCMLANLDCGTLTNEPYSDFLLDNILREVVSVAQVKGIPMNYSKSRQFMKNLFESSSHHCSMSQDAHKKVPTEIETITGALVREGKKHCVSTPVNESMYYLVKTIENNYKKLWNECN